MHSGIPPFKLSLVVTYASPASCRVHIFFFLWYVDQCPSSLVLQPSIFFFFTEFTLFSLDIIGTMFRFIKFGLPFLNQVLGVNMQAPYIFLSVSHFEIVGQRVPYVLQPSKFLFLSSKITLSDFMEGPMTQSIHFERFAFSDNVPRHALWAFRVSIWVLGNIASTTSGYNPYQTLY